MCVLGKTHFPKNGETHFLNAETHFPKAETHFPKSQNSFPRQFYSSWPVFNLNQIDCLSQKCTPGFFCAFWAKLISQKMAKLISQTPKLISKTPKLISRTQKLISQMAETHSRGVWLEWPRLDFAQKKSLLM